MREPYTCIQCNFTCKWKSDYERHLNTPKHRELKKVKKTFICNCGKEYQYRQGLHRHKLTCKYIEKEQENENNDIIYKKFAYKTLQKIQEHQKEIDNLLIMLTKKREKCV